MYLSQNMDVHQAIDVYLNVGVLKMPNVDVHQDIDVCLNVGVLKSPDVDVYQQDTVQHQEWHSKSKLTYLQSDKNFGISIYRRLPVSNEPREYTDELMHNHFNIAWSYGLDNIVNNPPVPGRDGTLTYVPPAPTYVPPAPTSLPNPTSTKTSRNQRRRQRAKAMADLPLKIDILAQYEALRGELTPPRHTFSQLAALPPDAVKLPPYVEPRLTFSYPDNMPSQEVIDEKQRASKIQWATTALLTGLFQAYEVQRDPVTANLMTQLLQPDPDTKRRLFTYN